MGYEFIPKDNVGTGDVVGPGSSTDNTVARFDGSGNIIQDSSVFIDDNGDLGIGAMPFAYDTGFYGINSNVMILGNDTETNAQSIIFKTLSYESFIYNDEAGTEFKIGTKPGGKDVSIYPNDVKTASFNADGSSNVYGTLTVDSTLFVKENIDVLNNKFLVLTNSTNDGSVNIQAPGNMVGSVFYTMPGVQGAANTVLQNTGTGSLFWSNNFAGGLTSNDDISITTLGKKLKIKEGINASMGVATLIGGTVTVSTTAIKSTSRVLMTHQNVSGIKGIVSLGTIIDSVSFEINSSTIGDSSNILWIIIDPS